MEGKEGERKEIFHPHFSPFLSSYSLSKWGKKGERKIFNSFSLIFPLSPLIMYPNKVSFNHLFFSPSPLLTFPSFLSFSPVLFQSKHSVRCVWAMTKKKMGRLVSFFFFFYSFCHISIKEVRLVFCFSFFPLIFIWI